MAVWFPARIRDGGDDVVKEGWGWVDGVFVMDVDANGTSVRLRIEWVSYTFVARAIVKDKVLTSGFYDDIASARAWCGGVVKAVEALWEPGT